MFVVTERESGSYSASRRPQVDGSIDHADRFRGDRVARRVARKSEMDRPRDSRYWTLHSLAFGFAIPIGTPGILPLSLLCLAFATFWASDFPRSFGGLSLLLFWNIGTPAASVPVEMYRLVASPLLRQFPCSRWPAIYGARASYQAFVTSVYSAL